VEPGQYGDNETWLGMNAHAAVGIHSEMDGIDGILDVRISFSSTSINVNCPAQPFELHKVNNSVDLEVQLLNISQDTNCVVQGLRSDALFPMSFDSLVAHPEEGEVWMVLWFERVFRERVTFKLKRSGPIPVPAAGILPSSYGCSGTHGVDDDNDDDGEDLRKDPLKPGFLLAGLAAIVFFVCFGCMFDVRRQRRVRNTETLAVEEATSQGHLNFEPGGGAGGGYGLVFRQVTYDVTDRDGDRIKARHTFREGGAAAAGGQTTSSPLRSILQAGRRTGSRSNSRNASNSKGVGAGGAGNMTAQYAAAREAAEDTAKKAKAIDPGKLRILDGVSGNIAPGQLVAILGASGSVSVSVVCSVYSVGVRCERKCMRGGESQHLAFSHPR
jgi:hypothetical protein